jgi:hypothetical protein
VEERVRERVSESESESESERETESERGVREREREREREKREREAREREARDVDFRRFEIHTTGNRLQWPGGVYPATVHMHNPRLSRVRNKSKPLHAPSSLLPPFAQSLKIFFLSFPVEVLGNSSRISTSLGTINLLIPLFSFAHSITCSPDN